MISFNKTDPINQLLNGFELEIQGKQYTNLLAWKFATLKNPNVTNQSLSSYIKLKGSKYLLHINLYYSYNSIYAIWDIEKSKGWILQSNSSNTLHLQGQEFFVFAVQNISEINAEIFENSQTKSFDDRCLDMLKSLASSKEHANKSSDELAVKAIKLVLDLDKQLNSVREMFNQNP